MSKIKTSASQFPNIYRLITESKVFKIGKNMWFRLPKQSKLKKLLVLIFSALFLVFSIVLITGSIILASDIYQKLIELNNINIQRQKIQSEISFWQSVLQKYPGYKDAYFKIAILEYQLKDYKNAIKDNDKALLLDPNFEDARKLSELLNKK